MNKAVVLLSGGLDSATCLALAKSQGLECYALSFSYGQRHSVELDFAKKIAAHYHVKKHHIISLALDQFGGSALTDQTIAVPDYDGKDGIPVTYVPARNTVFLSIALGLAEVVGAEKIFIGSSAIDYSGYPDCRPEYFSAFQAMANLATKAAINGQPITIVAPLVHLSKAETIQLGMKLGVDYAMTISCYRANEKGAACGTCDSCALRKKGFSDAKVKDPTVYY